MALTFSQKIHLNVTPNAYFQPTQGLKIRIVDDPYESRWVCYKANQSLCAFGGVVSSSFRQQPNSLKTFISTFSWSCAIFSHSRADISFQSLPFRACQQFLFHKYRRILNDPFNMPTAFPLVACCCWCWQAQTMEFYNLQHNSLIMESHEIQFTWDK